MKDYVISFTHTLGECSMFCYAWEVSGVLCNIARMAIEGHKFSNVTIKAL